MNPRDYTASMSKIKCSDNFKNKMDGILDNSEITKIEVRESARDSWPEVIIILLFSLFPNLII